MSMMLIASTGIADLKVIVNKIQWCGRIMHTANAFTVKLMTDIQETFRDFSLTVMMVAIATTSMSMPFNRTIDMLLLLKMKLLLVHAAISMVPTKTVHSM